MSYRNEPKSPERIAAEDKARADREARGLEVMRDADWKCARESFKATGRGREEVQPRYGFNYIHGNRAPYFALTGDVREHPGQRRDDWGGGCCHDTIVEAFPELADLVPWHLCDQDETPMHYAENATYAFKCYRGLQGGTMIPSAPYKPKDAESFFHAVCAGILGPEDKEDCRVFLETGSPGHVGDWLAHRAPFLRAAFLATMKKHGVPLMPGHMETVVLETKPDGTPRLVSQNWLVPKGTDMRNPVIVERDARRTGKVDA